MLNSLRRLFAKSSEEENRSLPLQEEATFVLRLGHLPVGELRCKEGKWIFSYTAQFKYRKDEFYPIVGFPDLDKVYESEVLWPFFQVRIPGLGQPVVRETIMKENINPDNEAALLKRFGRKTLANPFELILS